MGARTLSGSSRFAGLERARGWGRFLGAVVVLGPLAAGGAGQAGALERRAQEVAAIVSAEPKWSEELFDAAFLKQVPAAQLVAIGKQYHAMCGAVSEVRLTERKGEFAGTFDLHCEKQQVVSMTLTLGAKAPHSVVGLFFGPPGKALANWDEVVANLKQLPGKTALAVWKLGGEKLEVVAQHEPDLALAIGSAFKLYVLGALVEGVAAGRRKLGDVAALEARCRSLPSGELQRWPAGTPFTLASLAGAMISISDNTATDQLLCTLGRERVEGMLEPMGNSHAARSLPFLTTGELFRLKGTRGGAGAVEYLRRDLTGKREYLDKDVSAWPLSEEHLDADALARPNCIEELEWFASPADLCRAMDWLRVNTETGPAQPLRELLAINRGLTISKRDFPWVGYKGGSEPGVLALAYLLRDSNGAWYALTAVWNDPAEALEDTRLLVLVQRAIGLLAPGKTQ
jgi:beta-lactamase class A